MYKFKSIFFPLIFLGIKHNLKEKNITENDFIIFDYIIGNTKENEI